MCICVSGYLEGGITVDDSGTGQGTSFTVEFVAEPCADRVTLVSPAATAGNVASPLRLKNVRVFVADDSEGNLDLVSTILKQYGAMVETASNGVDAVNTVLAKGFDIVLMDIQMPQMDGYQATRTLRKAKYKGPIIALTAYAMAEERLMTKESGFESHLTKPIDVAQMVLEIERLVSGSRENS